MSKLLKYEKVIFLSTNLGPPSTLCRRTVVWGNMVGKVRHLVFTKTVEEDLLSVCSNCRRYVGVFGTPCGMLTCEGTDAIHDLPLGAVPRTP